MNDTAPSATAGSWIGLAVLLLPRLQRGETAPGGATGPAGPEEWGRVEQR